MIEALKRVIGISRMRPRRVDGDALGESGLPGLRSLWLGRLPGFGSNDARR